MIDYKKKYLKYKLKYLKLKGGSDDSEELSEEQQLFRKSTKNLNSEFKSLKSNYRTINLVESGAIKKYAETVFTELLKSLIVSGKYTLRTAKNFFTDGFDELFLDYHKRNFRSNQIFFEDCEDMYQQGPGSNCSKDKLKSKYFDDFYKDIKELAGKLERSADKDEVSLVNINLDALGLNKENKEALDEAKTAAEAAEAEEAEAAEAAAKAAVEAAEEEATQEKAKQDLEKAKQDLEKAKQDFPTTLEKIEDLGATIKPEIKKQIDNLNKEDINSKNVHEIAKLTEKAQNIQQELAKIEFRATFKIIDDKSIEIGDLIYEEDDYKQFKNRFKDISLPILELGYLEKEIDSKTLDDLVELINQVNSIKEDLETLEQELEEIAAAKAAPAAPAAPTASAAPAAPTASAAPAAEAAERERKKKDLEKIIETARDVQYIVLDKLYEMQDNKSQNMTYINKDLKEIQDIYSKLQSLKSDDDKNSNINLEEISSIAEKISKIAEKYNSI